MYIIIFIVIAALALLMDQRRPSIATVIGVFLFFFFLVGFRGPNVDNDYMNYLYSIKFSSLISEFSFNWISSFFYTNFNSTLLTFLFYALFGVGLKIIFFYRNANYFWLTLLVYFTTFFILQEMNAIRAGVASGFMLMSLEPWSRGEKLKTLSWLLLSVIFHYSFIILLPLVLFVRNTEKHLWYYIALIPLAYVMHFTIDMESILSQSSWYYFALKFDSYNDELGAVDVLSTVFLIKIAFIMLFFLFKKQLSENYKHYFLFLKLYCIGIFTLIVCGFLPAASMRLLDIFLVVELVMLPLFCDLFKQKWVPSMIIVLYAMFYYYLYVNMAHYIGPYTVIFQSPIY